MGHITSLVVDRDIYEQATLTGGRKGVMVNSTLYTVVLDV